MTLWMLLALAANHRSCGSCHNKHCTLTNVLYPIREHTDSEDGAEEKQDKRVQASETVLEETLLGSLHDASRSVQRQVR